ncbi:MAG: DUF4215 domain-containing protein [bacterium]|nr:DUF4215 domain-containing protein [bacterium]
MRTFGAILFVSLILAISYQFSGNSLQTQVIVSKNESLPVEPAICGNRILDLGEECDDGNTVSGDGCSATCQNEAAPIAVCGNGIIEVGEECDDGNTVSGDGCSATCTPDAVQGALNSLVKQSPEGAGSNCAYGGIKVESGVDDNGNGILDTKEIDNTSYVCNGQPGSNGTDGANGTSGKDGLQSLVQISNEPVGDNCSNGGQKVESGLDTNRDGNLDQGEVTSIKYVCNGISGTSGAVWITGSGTPLSPANENDLYLNSDNGNYYMYMSGIWVLQGTLAGADGASLVWLGSLASAPSSPALYEAYYDSTEGISYVFDGTTWNVLAKDGKNGLPGYSGTDGVNCWDLNANGLCEIASEDKNGDGVCDALDCKGLQGPSGTYVSGVTVDLSGSLVLTLSDGTVIDAGVVKGSNGIDGLDGASGAGATVVDNGDGTVTITDGLGGSTTVRNGTDGADGTNGIDGQNGISITGLSLDPSGNLVVSLSDGTSTILDLPGLLTTAINTMVPALLQPLVQTTVDNFFSSGGFDTILKQKINERIVEIPPGPDCGNGIVEAPEECDDAGPSCQNCQIVVPEAPPVCGDGKKDPWEDCDDGNVTPGDGCDESCQIEIVEQYCGDGIIDYKRSEECDDGNNLDGDGCSAGCRVEAEKEFPPICGDGNVDNSNSEECDDGNNMDGDGCSAACQKEAGPEFPSVCGDSFIDSGEACDDGNTISGDGCDGQCRIEIPSPIVGPPGDAGFSCWDADQDHVCDPEEDIGEIIGCTPQDDCVIAGPPGPEGPPGTSVTPGLPGAAGAAGTDGLNCFDDPRVGDANGDGVANTTDCFRWCYDLIWNGLPDFSPIDMDGDGFYEYPHGEDTNNDGVVDIKDCRAFCWDKNNNDEQNLEEDINGDGKWDTLDCQGEKGDQGLQGIAGTQGLQGGQGLPGVAGATGSGGLQGGPGIAGSAGRDGYVSRINLVPIPGSTRCPEGGTEIQTGVDSNANGILELSEVAQTADLCNGRTMTIVQQPIGPDVSLKGAAPDSSECPFDYADIANLTDEQKEALYFVSCTLGLIQGSILEDGRRYALPDQKVNRADVAAIYARYRLNAEEAIQALSSQLPQFYPDVNASVWYYIYVQVATHYGYMSGIGQDHPDLERRGHFEARTAETLELLRLLATLVSGDYPTVNDIYQRRLEAPGVTWFQAAYETFETVVGRPPLNIPGIDPLNFDVLVPFVDSDQGVDRIHFFVLIRDFYYAANPVLKEIVRGEMKKRGFL